jgi:hypothetical protein
MNGKDLQLAPIVNAAVVRTRRLEIVDDKSHTRAFVDTIEGEAVFCLTNEVGLRSIEIRAGKKCGAQISLIKDGAVSRLGIALTRGGNAIITMLDADGRERFKVEVDETGTVASKP